VKRLVMLAVTGFVCLVAFERLAPRRWLVTYWHLINPLTLRFAAIAPGWAVLETTGRRTGRTHRVPVGGRLEGSTFWIQVGHSGNSDYVKNIKANPQISLQTRGQRHIGTAHFVDAGAARSQILRRNFLTAAFTATASGNTTGIRIDLD
jgi:deazaflavin-dependent oxidoreductase (nitroreductase family)